VRPGGRGFAHAQSARASTRTVPSDEEIARTGSRGSSSGPTNALHNAFEERGGAWREEEIAWTAAAVEGEFERPEITGSSRVIQEQASRAARRDLREGAPREQYRTLTTQASGRHAKR